MTSVFVLCGILMSPLLPFMLVYAIIRYGKSKINGRMVNLAPALQFQCLPSSQSAPYRRLFRLRGTSVLVGQITPFGCLIWVNKSKRRAGSNKSDYTRLEVHLPRTLNLGLKIEPEFSNLTSLFDLVGKDIQINDEVFDKMFKIRANDSNAVYQFLTPQRKVAIYNAQQAMMKTAALQITDTMVEAQIHGTDMNAEEIIFVMRQLVAVAHQVSSPSPQR